MLGHGELDRSLKLNDVASVLKRHQHKAKLEILVIVSHNGASAGSGY